MKYVFIFSLLFFLQSCILRPPTLIVTDQYLLVKHPGQSLYMAEIKPLKMDSIFNYPSRYEVVESYAIVLRRNNHDVNKYCRIKMFFNKRHHKYKWMIWKDYKDMDKNYADTITIKPFVWYTISSELNWARVFLYWNGKSGAYEFKESPNPGAW